MVWVSSAYGSTIIFIWTCVGSSVSVDALEQVVRLSTQLLSSVTESGQKQTYVHCGGCALLWNSATWAKVHIQHSFLKSLHLNWEMWWPDAARIKTRKVSILLRASVCGKSEHDHSSAWWDIFTSTENIEWSQYREAKESIRKRENTRHADRETERDRRWES